MKDSSGIPQNGTSASSSEEKTRIRKALGLQEAGSPSEDPEDEGDQGSARCSRAGILVICRFRSGGTQPPRVERRAWFFRNFGIIPMITERMDEYAA